MIQSSFQHERYRALAFLADNPDGCTRAIMLGQGLSLALTGSLIRAGLATDQVDKRGRGRPLEARVRITEAGRQALAEHETTSL